MKWSLHKSLYGLCGVAMFMATACGAPQANNAGNADQTNSTANATSASQANTTTANNTTGAGAKAPMQWSSPPAMQIDPHKQYSAVFHTNYGDFTVQLFASESPKTVNNFVFLAKHNFYNNDKFFRIIKTFMIQTGDPLNNGTGGPGYQFADELPPKHPYAPGIVAMANAGPNTNGSQFFICTGQDAANLNAQPNYTEFGKVVSGMDVVEKIAAIPVVANPMMQGEQSKPTKDAFIQSIDIVEK
jgi:cyclophilin family peptidyl-prolyl cis-trans isomerase